VIVKIFGPPGTGKTTTLVRKITELCEKYEPWEILVSSFTRAAARELVRRDLPIPEENIGTLHAICWRALGRPKIAELHLKLWNEEHPDYAITTDGTVDVDDPNVMPSGQSEGARLMSQYQILRSKMIPQDEWDEEVFKFHLKWKGWKADHEFEDFTDLIERGILALPAPPDGQRVAFFDEAQDFTKLEMTLAMQWAEQIELAYFVGDDDQAIYGFKGGDNKTFYRGPADEKEYLIQSYRLPEAIVRKALTFIEQVEDREYKTFRPREEQGRVIEESAGFKRGDLIVDIAEGYVRQGKTVMILASCSYMLDPIKQALYATGLPWHNPYRLRRGDWNPMRRSSENRKTTLGRILEFFMQSDEEPPLRKLRVSEPGGPFYMADGWPLWTVDEFKSFLALLSTEKLRRKGKKGFKAALAVLSEPDVMTAPHFYNPRYQNVLHTWAHEWLSDEAILKLSSACRKWDLTYLQEVALAQKKDAMNFPQNVLSKQGLPALCDQPKVVIGTIHSVKGGEADVVILFPDLSPSSMMGYLEGGDVRDDVIRQMYVGMTRARETLVLCGPSSPNAVNWT